MTKLNSRNLNSDSSDVESQVENHADIPVDFDFFDIEKKDEETILFHISRLLPDAAHLTKEIVKSKCGTSIKVESEILGVISSIPIKKVFNFKDFPKITIAHSGEAYMIIYERLINMPWQTSVPMYKMLLEDKSLKKVEQFILVSKCDQVQVQKKANKRAKTVNEFVHCEDEVLFEDITNLQYFKHLKESRVFGVIKRSNLLDKITKIEKMQ